MELRSPPCVLGYCSVGFGECEVCLLTGACRVEVLEGRWPSRTLTAFLSDILLAHAGSAVVHATTGAERAEVCLQEVVHMIGEILAM